MPLSHASPSEQIAYLKLILNSTAEGFYAVDTKGRTTMCNSAFLKLLGFESEDEVIGELLHEIIHHSHPDGTAYKFEDCPIYQAASSGITARVQQELFFRKDGSSFPVEYRVQPIIQDGILRGAICTFSDISAQKQARAEVQDSQDRISVAMEAGLLSGSYTLDLQTDTVRGDERLGRLFSIPQGMAETGFPFHMAVDAIHPDDWPYVEANIQKTIREGGLYNAQYRLKYGRSWRWVQASGKVTYDEKGQPLFFIGVISDIDLHKREEMLYHDTQSQLRIAQEAGGIGLFTVDIPDNEIAVSPEFYRIYGVEPSDDPSPEIFERLVLPEDKARVSSKEGRARGDIEFISEYRIRRPSDGQIRWINRRSEIFYDENGKPLKMYGAALDITERKNLEIALRESEEFNRSIIDSSPDCLKVLDLEGHLVSMNEEGCRQMEVDDFSVCINQPWIGFWAGTDRAEAEKALTAARAGGVGTFEGFCATMKGTPKWWEVIVTPILGENGKPVRLLSVSRDISERRKLLEENAKAKNDAELANLAKTEFLANMSHEIRTPMNAIIGLTSILSMTSPLTDKQRQFVSTLKTSSDSLLSLINDLLDISKIEARTLELEEIPFSMPTLIQEVASIMAVRVKEKGLNFTGEGECVENRMFLGDPTRLRQIILNLCSNAVKFTEQGGIHVTITCHPHPDPDKETICVAVKDTGIGIAQDKIGTVFKKFMQADSTINRKYGGTGLGLAITKTLTEAMGGTVKLESELGKGSEFTVCVPLRVAPEQPERQSIPLDQVIEDAFEGKDRPRLLLVEDYEPNVLVATILLEKYGYTVDEASNGLQAVEKAKSRNYAAILMDVQMHGMNGLEATSLIRENEKKDSLSRVPIIGMTAHALAGDRERCIAAGMDDYVSKPFNPDELNAKIKKLID